MDSLLEQRHQPFFVQKVGVGSEIKGISRTDVMTQLCAGKRVLHVGCVDFPITDLKENLHIQLDAHCARLDGFDINSGAFEQMKPYLKGELYDKWEDIDQSYDIVLVPEVLEHVDNVADFLSKLSNLKATSFIITVPDAYQCFSRHFDYNTGSETFVEVVHPDHNCWYTPYTFQNTIKKYTDWDIKGMWFYNNISLLMIASIK
ncbi:hypothetical protein MRS45_13700 [Pseudomonas viridiflava]|uniref:class I SAM-dependent methyltransferase n=1 Tax=Pseudomonas viridiflava TaxID=33069 RepID=UPI0010BFC6A7|nr:hypothetical protein [Pseudomonas viridiflava]MBD8186775.1 hypothetical protein [Pseudomonas viridiflava]MBD8200133.1 hypothetical protein [Pseudomonas viridiflava]MCJ8177148.1 hypothetical protein [Pseudomonas viridiflava]MEE4092206.1 hypothetical protein [Pseudomonas viridiflava]TKJ66435.1 hypothetical protein PviCFBP13507_13210 [Pseudomonas viridiflava]